MAITQIPWPVSTAAVSSSSTRYGATSMKSMAASQMPGAGELRCDEQQLRQGDQDVEHSNVQDARTTARRGSRQQLSEVKGDQHVEYISVQEIRFRAPRQQASAPLRRTSTLSTARRTVTAPPSSAASSSSAKPSNI